MTMQIMILATQTPCVGLHRHRHRRGDLLPVTSAAASGPRCSRGGVRRRAHPLDPDPGAGCRCRRGPRDGNFSMSPKELHAFPPHVQYGILDSFVRSLHTVFPDRVPIACVMLVGDPVPEAASRSGRCPGLQRPSEDLAYVDGRGRCRSASDHVGLDGARRVSGEAPTTAPCSMACRSATGTRSTDLVALGGRTRRSAAAATGGRVVARSGWPTASAGGSARGQIGGSSSRSDVWSARNQASQLDGIRAILRVPRSEERRKAETQW